jgi:hypothetical protein
MMASMVTQPRTNYDPRDLNFQLGLDKVFFSLMFLFIFLLSTVLQLDPAQKR